MENPVFKEAQPVLPSQNVAKSIDFYVKKLGFKLMFQDNPDNPTYAGVRRGSVGFHLQWHDPKEWAADERPMLRFVIDSLEALFNEYTLQDVFHKNTKFQKTPWGTQEFAFYDPYMNGLAFYKEE